jgi:hypothetical protein
VAQFNLGTMHNEGQGVTQERGIHFALVSVYWIHERPHR